MNTYKVEDVYHYDSAGLYHTRYINARPPQEAARLYVIMFCLRHPPMLRVTLIFRGG